MTTRDVLEFVVKMRTGRKSRASDGPQFSPLIQYLPHLHGDFLQVRVKMRSPLSIARDHGIAVTAPPSCKRNFLPGRRGIHCSARWRRQINSRMPSALMEVTGHPKIREWQHEAGFRPIFPCASHRNRRYGRNAREAGKGKQSLSQQCYRPLCTDGLLIYLLIDRAVHVEFPRGGTGAKRRRCSMSWLIGRTATLVAFGHLGWRVALCRISEPMAVR